MAEKVTEADAIADLKRVDEELGHPPKLAEYREHGSYSAPTVAKYFDGSFTQARVEVLELEDSTGRMPEHRRVDLLTDLERVSEVVSREPSKGDYKDHGEYALSTITYRFDSWIDAKKEAGVYDGLNEGPTREGLLEDLQRVDDEHSGPVTQISYQKHGEWSFKSVQRWLGGWEEGCQQAGVTRPNMGPRTEETEALLEDIRVVAADLGRCPSKIQYNELGEFSYQMAKTRLGSWNDAVRESGFEPRQPGAQPGEMNANWAGGYHDYYGPTWASQRRKARKRDEYACADCGKTDAEHLDEYGWSLEVHHIIPFQTFDDSEVANELSNLVTLCREHHLEYEHKPPEYARELIE